MPGPSADKTTKLLGMKFGNLKVSSYAGDDAYSKPRWLCVCCCGLSKVVTGRDLTAGKTKYCGCRKASMIRSAKTVHGYSETEEYKIWVGIKQRCSNPNVNSFKYYGGRGITICGPWKDSFETFYADVGPRPSSLHSIDRYPNYDGNYEPGNVRWATQLEQCNNSARVVAITHNGQTKTASQWASMLGITSRTVRKRLSRGWSIERTLSIRRTLEV